MQEEDIQELHDTENKKQQIEDNINENNENDDDINDNEKQYKMLRRSLGFLVLILPCIIVILALIFSNY